MDLKILITATLLEADKAELQKKIEALVMDFVGEHINQLADTYEGSDEVITHYDVTIK